MAGVIGAEVVPQVRWLPAERREDAAVLWSAVGPPQGLADSWPWTAAWLAAYGDVVAHRFAVVEEGQEVLACALVTQRTVRTRGVALDIAALGTSGEPDRTGVYTQYQRWHARPEAAARAGRALMAELADQPWQRLELAGFVPDDADALQGDRQLDVRRERAWTVAVPDAGADVTAGFGSATRKVLRRLRRRHADVVVEEVKEPARLTEALAELAHFSTARWKGTGVDSSWASPAYRAALATMLPPLLAQDLAVVLRLRDGDGTLAVGIAFVDGDRLLDYQTARRPGADGSPGQLLVLAMLEHAAQRRLRVLSHQTGDSEHKQRLSNGSEELVWARWDRGTLRVAARVRRRLLGVPA